MTRFHLVLHPVSLHILFWCFFAVVPGRIHGPRRGGRRRDGCRGRHSGAWALAAPSLPKVTSAILGSFLGWSYCCVTLWDGQSEDNWRTSETVISVSDLCLFDGQTHIKRFLTPLRPRESRKVLVRFQDVDDSDDFLQHPHQQRSAHPWHINCESWRSDGTKRDQGKSSSERQQEKEANGQRKDLGNHNNQLDKVTKVTL